MRETYIERKKREGDRLTERQTWREKVREIDGPRDRHGKKGRE